VYVHDLAEDGFKGMQLVSFESDDYHSATAKTTKKAEQLVEAGFEYVCTTPQDVMLFRKRK